MRLNKIIFFFLFASITLASFGQNDSLNRQKYWCLRQRLITKFVKPGPGPGESLPATRMSMEISWASNPAKLFKKLSWGDATMQLGWYLGVMATEIELLQRSNKTHDEYFDGLVRELYYGLNAINRLDDYAEIVWGYAPDDCDTRIDKVDPVLWDSRNKVWLPKPGSNDKPERNGFCLRMDGNEELLEYFTDVSLVNTIMVRPWVKSDTMGLTKSGINAGKFGYYSADPFSKDFEYRANGYYAANELSQDQMFHMLMGIMLITEFVEEDVKYKGISLNGMAREIGLRLIGTYKGTEFRNPKRPNRSVCNKGGNSIVFWPSIKKVKHYLQTGKKNNVKDQILLWGKLDCITSYAVNRALYIAISSIANTTPQQDLCRYSTSDGFDWGIWYLIRRAIYNPPVKNSGCTYDAEQVKLELNLCPFRGPHIDDYEYGPNGDFYIPKTKDGTTWKKYTRQEIVDSLIPIWHFSNRYWQQCIPNSGDQKNFILFPGEFNGLDYMLLYNISNIVFGTETFGGNYPATRELYFTSEQMIPK